MYIVHSVESLISQPSKTSYDWKSTVGPKGGIAVLEMNKQNENFCMDCLYVGYLETEDEGKVSFIVNIEDNDIPMILTNGMTFPDNIKPNQHRVYRVVDLEKEKILLSIS